MVGDEEGVIIRQIRTAATAWASKRHRAEVFGVIETALRAHFARQIES